MKSRLMISVAAISLIAGAGLANAQGGMKNESGGAATQQNAPSGGAGGTMGRESTGSSAAQSPQSEEKSPGATKGQRAEEKTPGATKSQQRTEENAPGAKKGMSSENETKGGAKDMKAEGREGQGKNAESREGQNNNMKAEGRDNSKNAQTREGQNDRSQTTTGQAGAGAKISTEQRTKITTIIRNEHVAPATNVNFSIAVGTRVPREGVSLRPLPAEVVTVYPEWRGYEFILVRNQILVIDPATLEIVAILEA
jgi:Protein of unknown function (DUF1236)